MDPDKLRRNERLKAGSGVMTNLGTALLAAAAARWFAFGFDAFVFQWLVAASMIIWTGLHLMNALEVDNADR
jgi:hypothetical protein